MAKHDDFTTAAIALQSRPPARLARMVTLTLCAMASVALMYAAVARMDIVVSAQGRVIPSGKSKIVQPLEAGVIRRIAVRDGQRVAAGEVLLELDPTSAGADQQRLQREAWEAEAEVLGLEALLKGQGRFAAPAAMPAEIAANQQAVLTSHLAEQQSRITSLEADVARRRADHDAIAANLVQIRASLPLVRKKNDMRETLARTGYMSEMSVIETRLEVINLDKDLTVQENRLHESQASLRAAISQLAQASAEMRGRASVELVEATRKRDSARQELVKATQRSEQQVLKAPLAGVVQQLAVTTVGGVVTPAQALMTIVPDNAVLEVEAQMQNRDAGHVRVGQRVVNKIETFDFTRYGYIEGEVQWVGTDAVIDPKLGPVYPVRIRLAASQMPNLVNGRHGVITPGMSVTSDIRVSERRLIEYFLAPMLRYKEESLRER